MQYDLSRFLSAQETLAGYALALSEIRNGRKVNHWIWYIFPQLRALGRSENATFYGLEGLDEARAYLQNTLLHDRLLEISRALLAVECDDAERVMGSAVDKRKLRSSMTLFAAADPGEPVFRQVLEKYYGGRPDPRTLELLETEAFASDKP